DRTTQKTSVKKKGNVTSSVDKKNAPSIPGKRNVTSSAVERSSKNDKEQVANDWTVNVSEIKDYDISAKNPNKIVEVVHQSPKELIAELKANDDKIQDHLRVIEELIGE